MWNASLTLWTISWPARYSAVSTVSKIVVLFLLQRYYLILVDLLSLPYKLSTLSQATWHMGHSLAQTVFSCIYVLRPERTSSHALLHSFCRVIRATCRALVSVVSDARTNEVN